MIHSSLMALQRPSEGYLSMCGSFWRFRFHGTVIILLAFTPPAHANPDRVAQQAKRIESELNADIEETTKHLAKTLELKDIETGEAKAVLNGTLRQRLKDKLITLAGLQNELNMEKKGLKAAQKRAHEKVGEIEKLKEQLSLTQWILAAVGPGFLFACITAWFQYKQHKRSEEKHRIELDAIRRQE